MRHTLVIYRASERADVTLAGLARAAREHGERLTVLALAVEERQGRGCCDTRSVLWNGIEREFAERDLMQARVALDDAPDVELDVLLHTGRRVAETIEQEAQRRSADEIVVADPRTSGISRRELRRLRELTLAA